SSVRAVVYDIRGRLLDSTLSDVPYKVQTTEAGEVSSDPDDLVKLIATSIDKALKAARKANVTILAAGASCYWHSLMGIDRQGRPTTELLTWADTRSAPETRRLRARFDERAYHTRTGCFFHASYWPAKLRWLRATRPSAFRRTTHWISLGEYLYQQLLGQARVSLSIASGTGLLDVRQCHWDAQALELAGIDWEHLSPLEDGTQPFRSLRPAFARRWPELRQIPWFLPQGDGGLANVGAGCTSPRWLCATIGTSGALRVILDQSRVRIPWGTFVYRLDRRRFVVGGALSEGGNVVRWFTRGLGAKPKKKLERAAADIAPDSHGLTVLPFWAGERSPNWRGSARAAITGLSLATQAGDLMRAIMESIGYQFAAVFDAMLSTVPRPRGIVATGGRLAHSTAWSQILADALGIRVIESPQPEASSRGAALMALHALGHLPGLWRQQPSAGRTLRPRPRVHALYAAARARQERLYQLLLPPAAEPEPETPSATNNSSPRRRLSVARGSGSRRRSLRSRGARR
ncbi:MAG TPA: gluconokinase, partial [Chloroflexota bacterium]|nr:gluconokinase [Chloroflexota bacterium]